MGEEARCACSFFAGNLPTSCLNTAPARPLTSHATLLTLPAEHPQLHGHDTEPLPALPGVQALPTAPEAAQPPALSDLRRVGPREKAYDRVHRCALGFWESAAAEQGP